MEPTKESERVKLLIDIIVNRYQQIESTVPLLSKELSEAERKVLKVVASVKKVTIGSIGKALNLPASTTTWLVGNLVKRSILKREQDQSDRRKIWIGLTEKGGALAGLMERIPDRIAADLLYKLDPEQRQTFVLLVDKALSKIEESGSL
jgi:DNA-binding MarR family transcriptional regulator